MINLDEITKGVNVENSGLSLGVLQHLEIWEMKGNPEERSGWRVQTSGGQIKSVRCPPSR